jgi:hypothetical protein
MFPPLLSVFSQKVSCLCSFFCMSSLPRSLHIVYNFPSDYLLNTSFPHWLFTQHKISPMTIYLTQNFLNSRKIPTVTHM